MFPPAAWFCHTSPLQWTQATSASQRAPPFSHGSQRSGSDLAPAPQRKLGLKSKTNGLLFKKAGKIREHQGNTMGKNMNCFRIQTQGAAEDDSLSVLHAKVCSLAEEYRQIVAVLQANPQLLGEDDLGVKRMASNFKFLMNSDGLLIDFGILWMTLDDYIGYFSILWDVIRDTSVFRFFGAGMILWVSSNCQFFVFIASVFFFNSITVIYIFCSTKVAAIASSLPARSTPRIQPMR